MEPATPEEILALFHGSRTPEELPKMEHKAARLLARVYKPTSKEINALVELAPREPTLREPQGFPPEPPILTSDEITTAQELYHAAAHLLHEIRTDPAGLRERLASAADEETGREPDVPHAMGPAAALLVHRRLVQVAEFLVADRARQAHRSRARRWGGSSRRGRPQRLRA